MKLFEKTVINGLEIKNRLVRSATWEGMAEETGECTNRLLELYEKLALGGAGLIISGYAYVRDDGKGAPWMIGMHDDKVINGYKELVNRVHEHGAKIVCQLVHTGALTFPERIGGKTPIAPSEIPERATGIVPRAMTTKDIKEVIQAFIEASARAKYCGFDAVQIHAAHGFLISQFMSAYSNKRKDEYGDNRENRARFCLDVYLGIRQELSDDYPIMIKMNCHDFMDAEGITLKDSVFLAKKLGQYGIDVIEVSGGTPASGEFGPSRKDISALDEEAYFLEMTEEINRSAMVPIMLVGGLRTPSKMEDIIANEIIDYASMSRPFIYEPDLPNRWASGDLTKAKCISCNDCFATAKNGKGIYCVTRHKLEKNKDAGS